MCQFFVIPALRQSLYSILSGTMHEVQFVCSNLTPLALFIASYFTSRVLTILSFHSPSHTHRHTLMHQYLVRLLLPVMH